MLTAKSSLFICKLKVAMLFVVGFAVFSCEKEDDYLSLSVDELSIPVDGKEVTFTVRSNANWNIAVADSWAKANKTYGSGEASVTVKVGGNYSDKDRTTTLSVSSGALVETISITQSTVSFSLSLDEIRFDASGTAVKLDVTANSGWTLFIPDETAWCEADVLSGNGNGVITLSPKPYTERVVRKSAIIFNSFNTKVELTASQEIDNEPPTVPVLLSPEDGSQGEGIPVSFSWKASTDADGDEVRYFLCLSSDDGLTWNDTVTTTATNLTLTSGYIRERTAYSWKVVAGDLFGGESESLVSRFVSGTTERYKDGEVITYQTYSAPDVNRGVNLVVVGDGFIAEDYEKSGAFDMAVEKAVDAFFKVEPYPTYRDYFTVYKVVAYSEERGATVENNVAHSSQKKQTKNTVFNSVLDGGTSTRIDCDKPKVFNCALKIPALTKEELPNTTIIVIINLDVYAGTAHMYSDGSSITLCPMGRDSFEEIVSHEAGGHGFGRLLDEYIYNKNERYPDADRDELVLFRQGDVWSFGANLDVTGKRDEVHWKHYFEKAGYEMVDLFEGGGLYGKGVWRPEQNSCMNDNAPYFNAPSREAIVRRIMKITNKAFDYGDYYRKDKIVPAPTRSTAPWIPLAPPVLEW
jgi:hypothetical protein